MKRAFGIVFLCALLCAFTGCKSIKHIEQVPVEVHDTAYIAKTVHDSTYIDRWRTVEVKGDTVFLTNNQITVKYRTVTDTAYKYIEKPVEVKVSQIKEVERGLRWWQKTLMWTGALFLLIMVVYMLWQTSDKWIGFIEQIKNKRR